MGAFIGFIIFVAIIYYIFKLFEHSEREKTDSRNNDIETTSTSSKKNITKNTSASSKKISGEAVNTNVNSNIDSNADSKELFDEYMQILRDTYSEHVKQSGDKKFMTLGENSLSFHRECPNGEIGFFVFAVAPRSGLGKKYSNLFEEEYALTALLFIGLDKSSAAYYSGLVTYCNLQNRRFDYQILYEDDDTPVLMIEGVIGDPSKIEDVNNSKDAYQFICDLIAALDIEVTFMEEAKKAMAKGV